MMAAIAKMLDSAPRDVQQRIISWLVAKYAWHLLVPAEPAQVVEPKVWKWPVGYSPPPFPPNTDFTAYSGCIPSTVLCREVSNGFPVADVSDSAVEG